jgi:hypothetical protein
MLISRSGEMLGSRKNVQEMTVEEFVAGQKTGTTADGRVIGTTVDGLIVDATVDGNGTGATAEGDVAGGSGGAPDLRVWLVRATAVAAGLFVLCIIALVRIGRLDGDVALMRSQMGGAKVEGLKSQSAAVSERSGKPDGETEQLRMRVARLERDLEVVKLHSTRGAKAEGKAKTPVKKADKKKSQPR